MTEFSFLGELAL